jgi:phosphatidylserine/phosphatidylglycerophosphate/cardiolipin synthase-like enzyme
MVGIDFMNKSIKIKKLFRFPKLTKNKTYDRIFYAIAFVLGMATQAVLIPTADIQAPLIKSDKISCRVCFTPDQACLPLIIDKVDKAQKTIQVQAYSFTSKPIADALIRAHIRGVSVIVIADKSQKREGHTQIHSLKRAGIAVYIDIKPSISHSKLILIDGITTIGGSYNYSEAAEKRNVENVTFINSKELTSLYVKNFNKRQRLSVLFN